MCIVYNMVPLLFFSHTSRAGDKQEERTTEKNSRWSATADIDQTIETGGEISISIYVDIVDREQIDLIRGLGTEPIGS